MQRFLICLLMIATTHALAAQKEIPKKTLPADPVETVNTPPKSPTEPLVAPSAEPELNVTEPAATNTPPPAEPTVTPAPSPKSFSSQTLRGLSRFTGNLHYSYLSTWIPGKLGISGGYIFSERWTLEAEYTKGSLSADFHAIDFGSIEDKRYGIQGRWFPSSNSFNLIVGFFKSEFTARLGNSIVSHMSAIPEENVWKFESYGPQVGLANRWQWQNGFTLGVDWFVMYVPLFGKTDDSVLKYLNSSDRSDIDKVSGWVRNIPQFDLFKFTLGYTF